jgi:type VI secretion system secreted protein Hcp
VVVKNQDAASPVLMTSAASGKHFKLGLLVARREGGQQQQEFLKVTLQNVLVSDYATAGPASERPTEQIKLSFEKISLEYYPIKPDGTLAGGIVGGFDFATNKKF